MAKWVPRPALLGVVMGLGFSFMLEGIRMMAGSVALFFSGSVGTLLRLFPQPVLGVILFIVGAELALSSRDPQGRKEDGFVVIATAAFAVLHVGVAVLFEIAAHVASRRGWPKF